MGFGEPDCYRFALQNFFMHAIKTKAQAVALTVCFFLLTSSSFAQSIKGHVIDAATGEALAGATVTLTSSKQMVVAKLDGAFVFRNVAEGRYSLAISYSGYQLLKQDVKVGAGENEVSINLQPINKELSSVIVSSQGDGRYNQGARNLERRADALINVLSSKTIQLLPDITVANALQRVSGVTIEKSSSGEGRYPIIRGMEKRYINTLVNGIKIPSPDNKNRFIPLDLFPSELLERLEVSKSLTPSMEGDAIGGTINLVMKDAPQNRLFQVNVAAGYNTILNDQRFQKFDKNTISKQSPNERAGNNTYAAVPADFSNKPLVYSDLKTPVNTTFGITYGDRFGSDKKFGFIIAGSYQNLFRGTNSTFFLPNSQPGANNIPQFIELQHRTYSTQNKRIGASAKLDYQLNKNNRLSLFNTLINLDDYQSRIISDTIALNSLVDARTRTTWQYQSIYNSTLQGVHNISPSFKIDWSLVYSVANNHIPQQTEFTHEYAIVTTALSADKVQGLSSIWLHNSDKDYSAYLNITKQTKLFGQPLEIKAGGLIRRKERDNFYNTYSLKPVLNELFTTISDAVFVTDGSSPKPNGNNYTVNEDIQAGYLQGKWQLSRKLELLGGVRVEHTQQKYETQFGPEIPNRSGRIWYTDVLPSAQAKYALDDKQALRFAYYKALARPGFADIIPDGTQGEELPENGNPAGLNHSTADNFDIRYENFPGAGNQVLLGVFYKNIKDPIEYSIIQGINTSQAIQPVNWGKATNYGFEAVITKYIGVFGISTNYTYTKSEITTLKKYKYRDPITTFLTSKDTAQTRPLQGQSNHIGNVSLLYKNSKTGLDIQLAFVYTGERLIQVNPFYNFDYWQSPASQLDLSFEQRFLKKFSFYGKLTNLTDAPAQSYIRQSYTSYTAGSGKPLALQSDVDNKIYVQKNNFKPAYLFGFRYKL